MSIISPRTVGQGNWAATEAIFLKIEIGVFFENVSEKLKFD